MKNKNVNKFFLKSKVFWVNFISLVIMVSPEFLNYLVTNPDFSMWLKEYNTPMYMILFSISAFINISLRFKASEKLTFKKKKKKEIEEDEKEE